MILAESFEGAVEVAEQHCREWLLAGNGEVFREEDLHEVAKEFDTKTPLAEDEFLVVTDDGSIGILFPQMKEPEMFFVSPEWAVVNILKEDPRKYMIAGDGGAAAAVGAGAETANAAKVGNVINGASYNGTEASAAFCKNCGAPLEPGSLFCGECGAKNAPEFCSNCGAKLNPGSKFCANCGAKV